MQILSRKTQLVTDWFNEDENDVFNQTLELNRNWAPVGDFGPLWETALSSTIIKTPNGGISSERMVFLPPVELTGSSDAYLHLKTFYYGFTLTCQPTSCWMNVTAHSEALPFFSVTNTSETACLMPAHCVSASTENTSRLYSRSIQAATCGPKAAP